jgi:hypothetical protein
MNTKMRFWYSFGAAFACDMAIFNFNFIVPGTTVFNYPYIPYCTVVPAPGTYSNTTVDLECSPERSLPSTRTPMNWGEASESDEEVSDTGSLEDTSLKPSGGNAVAVKSSPGVGADSKGDGSAESKSLPESDGLGTTNAPLSLPPVAFMSMAKPLSRAVRAQLSGLLTEQYRLLERMREKYGAIEALPQVKEVRAIMLRIPEYQKKLLWIKQSMGRTQAIVDQTKRESLALQEKVSASRQRITDRKLAEARRDEQLKAKVVTTK